VQVLPEVVRVIESFDPSLVRSVVPNYILAEFTAKHVKVVLTGEGADEIFAGYEYLEGFRTEEEPHTELVRTIEGLHDLNLQRADHVTMAHGLEARVPFLELDMISLGLSLPAGWKLAGADQPGKRLLRMAFAGWLPDGFPWRKKAQFGEGSGATSVLLRRMEERASRKKISSASATRSSPRCAPARRSPTTESSPRTSARSAPNVPSAASPQRSHPAGGPDQIRGQRSSPRRSSAQGGSYVR
jgi:asparagine synthetase B (glutamine-hydrolysing)